jgi:hypothetical protein
MELNFQVKPRAEDALVASLVCLCGGTPRVVFKEGASDAVDDC